MAEPRPVRHAHIAGADSDSAKEKETRDSDTSSQNGLDALRAAHTDAKAGEKTQLDLDGNEKIEIVEEDCYDELGFSFPTWKKWTILVRKLLKL